MDKKGRKLFKSERGILLVYQGMQASPGVHMLTVESYIKWYSIYAVSPSGVVSKLSRDLARRYEEEEGRMAWGDHVPHPDFCEWIPETFPEYEWDAPSLDMIRGRWWEYVNC